MSNTGLTAQRNIILIGASAGGVEAMLHLAENLPPHIDAAIFFIMHRPSNGDSHLTAILSRQTKIQVCTAVDGEEIEPNKIYIAPANRHLVFERNRIQLHTSPKVNGFRPSIDVTFESAAETFGCQTIGVILSGALDDGTAGLQAIQKAGGTCIVQDPEDALFASMPMSALQQMEVDYILPAVGISAQLVKLVQEPLIEPCSPQGKFRSGDVTAVIDEDINDFEVGMQINSQSVLTCPDCGGVMWVTDPGGNEQYICHTGHRFSRESLLNEQSQAVELALRTAVRALRERAMFCGRLASRAREHGHPNVEKRFLTLKREAEENQKTILALFSRPGAVDTVEHLSDGEKFDPS